MIITVSREFGSGGRSIAKAVAEQLDVPYYDKELIKQVAEKTGFTPEFVEEKGEYSSSKSILSYLSAAFASHHGDIMQGMTAADFLWAVQRQVILDLADQGDCVIVGRCADWILKDRQDVMNVFIWADEDYKAKRIVRLYGESEKTPEERLRDKDTRRSVNYKHFTDRQWGVCQNYDLVLNSGRIGEERCVELICQLAKEIVK